MSENSALSALLRRRAEYLCYRFAQPPKCELVHTLPFQAIFFRSRHQPRRPPLAKIKPGSPVPTLGMGTATRPPGIVLVELRSLTGFQGQQMYISGTNALRFWSLRPPRFASARKSRWALAEFSAARFAKRHYGIWEVL